MHYKHLNKDYKRRLNLKNNEITFYLWNVLKNCVYLPQWKQKELITLLLKTKSLRKSTIKNICLETSLERSIISKFGISRHIFKKKAANLNYPGIRKASW